MRQLSTVISGPGIGMKHLLLLPVFGLVLAPDPRAELTNYIPMEISAPSGDKAANIKVTSHPTLYIVST